MPLLNTSEHYGTFTKAFHWTVVLLFAFQYAAGYTMTSLTPNETALGFTQNNYYNWHKSIGLIALAVAVCRLITRTFTALPDWHPGLNHVERRLMHIYENVLYTAMFVMPITGYFYVMAGGYGVHFFELIHLPNPIGKWPLLATIMKWAHVVSSYVIIAALVLHLAVVLRHQIILKDGLLSRMLPGRGK